MIKKELHPTILYHIILWRTGDNTAIIWLLLWWASCSKMNYLVQITMITSVSSTKPLLFGKSHLVQNNSFHLIHAFRNWLLGGLHVHVGKDLLNLQGLFQFFQFTFPSFENLSILITSLYILKLTCNYCYNKKVML